MALTANRLRAVVTAETADGVKKLREFGDEFKRTRDKAQQEANGISEIFKGAFGAIALSSAIGGVGRGLVGVFSTVSQGMRGVLSDAFTAVREYQMLEMGLQQLTATQILKTGFVDDMADALAAAAIPAQDLIKWIEQLAIKSPFNMSQVAGALRMAEAFGFTEGQAKRLTEAMTDFSAGAGLTGDYINRIMLNLGQMAAAGKITGREIRDLAMAGLPVKSILADAFGVSTAAMTDMLEDGAVPLGKGLEAIVTYLETNFKGAAARTTETWQGLISSLGEIKEVDLRLLFGGVFEAFRPEVAKIVDFLSSDDFKGKLEAVGTDLGVAVKEGVKVAKDALATMFEGSAVSDVIAMMASGDFAGAIATVVGEAVSLGLEITAGALTVVDAVRVVGELFVGVLSALSAKIEEVNNVKTPVDYGAELADWMLGRKSGDTLGAGGGGSGFGQDTGIFGKFSSDWASVMAEGEKRSADVNTRTEGLMARIAKAITDNRETQAALASSTSKLPGEVSGALENAGFDNIGETVTDASEEAARKLAAAIEKATSLISSKLDKGIEVSKRLGDVTGDPMAAGANGPFEALYRIQDVALNWNKPGADTFKWAEMYGVDQASAMSIIKDFQAGNFTDQVTKFIDTDALKGIMSAEADAKASQQRFAESIGADPAFMAKLMGDDPLTVPAAHIDSAAGQLVTSAANLNAAASALIASPSLPPEDAGAIVDGAKARTRGYLPLSWDVRPPDEMAVALGGIAPSGGGGGNGGASGWGSIKKAADGLVGRVRAWFDGIDFSKASKDLAGWLDRAGADAVGWVETAYNNARDFLNGISFGSVVPWVLGAFGRAVNWINSINFAPVTEWVTGAWNRVTGLLGGITFADIAEFVAAAAGRVSAWLAGIAFDVQELGTWLGDAAGRVGSWLGGIELADITGEVSAAWNRVSTWLGGIDFTGFDLASLVDGVRGRVQAFLDGISFAPKAGGGGKSGAGGEASLGGLGMAGAGNMVGFGSGGGGSSFADRSPYLPMLTQGDTSSWLPMLLGGGGKPGESSWLPTVLGSGGAVLSKEDSDLLARSFKGDFMTALETAGAEQPSVMTSLVMAGGGKVDVSTWLPTFLSSVDSGLQGENGKAIEEKGGSAWGIFEKGFVAKARNSSALSAAVEAMVEGAISKILGD